eukprot:scaffold160806_cov15-Prasinocladus_malaysianus.AAC.2
MAYKRSDDLRLMILSGEAVSWQLTKDTHFIGPATAAGETVYVKVRQKWRLVRLVALCSGRGMQTTVVLIDNPVERSRSGSLLPI